MNPVICFLGGILYITPNVLSYILEVEGPLEEVTN